MIHSLECVPSRKQGMQSVYINRGTEIACEGVSQEDVPDKKHSSVALTLNGATLSCPPEEQSKANAERTYIRAIAMKLYLCVSIALSLVGAALSSSLDRYDDLDAQYFPNDWTNMQGKQLQTRMHVNLSKFIRLRVHPEYRVLHAKL